MPRAHIGFGGNLGHVEVTLHRALAAVALLPATRIARVSSLYRTAPVGLTDQPDFVNGALEVETELAPEELLAALLRIEGELGRTRALRWGPRTVDLDLLLYGDRVVAAAGVEVPHPRMHERGFVLVPLTEIAPDAVHPALGRTVRELREALGPTPDVRLAGPSPWAGCPPEGSP
ncbi:MAG: 2-amino-4-hydroxy-6-hydroxymethyldihydropteridine diphosphokinase [Deferrisomatales bacterium]